MGDEKPSRRAYIIAGIIGILAIGVLGLLLYAGSAGLAAPTEPPSFQDTPAPEGDVPEEDVPAPEGEVPLTQPPVQMLVLASETQHHDTYTRTIDYLYNERGQLVQERWNGGIVTIDYLYYENGNPMAEIKANADHVLYAIDYREDGTKYQMVENSYYQSGEPSSTATTLYDEHGTILSFSDIAVDGRYSTQMAYTNEYDSQGRLIRQETRWAENDTLLHVDTWDYHESGWVLDSTEYNGDPNDNPVWIHETHSFNPDGTSHRLFRDIMDTAPCFELHSFYYDDQGNPTRQVWEIGQPGDEYYSKYTLEFQNTYENGHLVKVEVYSSDVQSYDGKTEETPATLTLTRIQEFDDEGNLIFYDNGSSTYSYTYLPLSQALAS